MPAPIQTVATDDFTDGSVYDLHMCQVKEPMKGLPCFSLKAAIVKYVIYLRVHNLAEAFIQSDLHNYNLSEGVEQYIAVGTVMMFIEPSAKH